MTPDDGTMLGMKNRRWGRRLLIAGIWAMAMSTWGSIGHYVFGLADFGPVLTAMAVAMVLAWPAPLRHGVEASAGPHLPTEQARASRI